MLSLQLDPRGTGLELQTKQPNEFYDELPSIILNENVPITGFSSPDNNLESIFKYLVKA